MSDITCGIYLYDLEKKLFLIGHVTNAGNAYSIPKGLHDETDADYFATAIRELQEETSIDYNTLNIIKEVEFGIVPYKNSNRKFKSYLVIYNNGENTLSTECLSNFVDESGQEFPEIDSFLWIRLEDAENYLSEVQLKYLPKISSIIKNLES